MVEPLTLKIASSPPFLTSKMWQNTNLSKRTVTFSWWHLVYKILHKGWTHGRSDVRNTYSLLNTTYCWSLFLLADLWHRNYFKKMEWSVLTRHLCLIAIPVQMIKEQKFVTTFHKHKYIGDGAHLPWLPDGFKQCLSFLLATCSLFPTLNTTGFSGCDICKVPYVQLEAARTWHAKKKTTDSVAHGCQSLPHRLRWEGR